LADGRGHGPLPGQQRRLGVGQPQGQGQRQQRGQRRQPVGRADGQRQLPGRLNALGRGQRVAQLAGGQLGCDVVLPGVDFDRRRGPFAQGKAAVGEAGLFGQRAPPQQGDGDGGQYRRQGQGRGHQGDLGRGQQRPGAGDQGHDQPHQQRRRQRPR